MWPGTHCSTALETSTSTGRAGRQSRMSPSAKLSRSRPAGLAAGPRAIISGELSTPTTSAAGQRPASGGGQVARTAAQVDHVTRVVAPTRREQVEERPARSPANRRYWPGSHMSPLQYLDIKILDHLLPSIILDVKRYAAPMEHAADGADGPRGPVPADEVDDLVAAWHAERPDLDVGRCRC